MKKDKIPILGWLWIAVLVIGATTVVMTVNFKFQENMLKSELISHNAITSGVENACICPMDGTTGLAYCMHCGTPMVWHQTSRHFICPKCQTVGIPRCPKCNLLMTVMPKTKKNANDVITGLPIPVY